MTHHKVLFVSPHVDNYGAERSLVTLMKQLKNDGNEVCVVIPQHGNIESLLIENGLNYHITRFFQWANVGQGTRLYYGMAKYLYNEYASFTIVRKLKKEGFIPDIVHVNVVGTELGIHLKRKFGSKLVWHLREMGKQDFDVCFDLGDKIASRIMRKADIFVAISEAVKTNYLPLIPEDKIVCVYNGVKEREYISKNHLNNSFNVLFIGRLSSEKGQEDSIRALDILVKQNIHDITLYIFGNGGDENKLKKLVEDLHLDDYVKFMGYCNQIDYSLFDVGLMCSKCEAFGRVTADYMMNSLPVIGANTGATPEIVEDGITGLLYQQGNSYDLAEKIKLMRDDNVRQRMGREAHNRAMKYFSEKIYFENIKKVYDLL